MEAEVQLDSRLSDAGVPGVVQSTTSHLIYPNETKSNFALKIFNGLQTKPVFSQSYLSLCWYNFWNILALHFTLPTTKFLPRNLLCSILQITFPKDLTNMAPANYIKTPCIYVKLI